MPAIKSPDLKSMMFSGDGSVPNNPHLPFLFYRNAIDLAGTANPEEAVENVFRNNGWGEMWRNGIYEYSHYHSMTHEVMGIARGRAKVRFGGAKGRQIDLAQGDVVVLPAGTGHQGLWVSPELVVIGAYATNGRFDVCRGSKVEYAKAIEAIPQVPLPESDPAFGKKGPLMRLWRVNSKIKLLSPL
jgi:uncharacterized protein YjlB